MKLIKTIDLPVHSGNDGFDHADIHFATSRLYVAHTLNHAIDVIDCEKDEYLSSIADCPGVAGILVSNTRDLMFSSNRGEDTVSIFSTTLDEDIGMLAAGKIPINKVNVGQGPNGMAFDATRGTLLVANVGRGGASGSPSVSIIDVKQTREVARISMLGRTRWAMYDASQDMFFVNIANPASIVCIDAKRPREIARTIPVPVAGPHGLGIDTLKARLLCACDAAVMAAIDLHSGEILDPGRDRRRLRIDAVSCAACSIPRRHACDQRPR